MIGPKIYDIIKDQGGNIGIIMEFLKKDYNKFRNNLLNIVIDTFENLHKLHENSIVHGDIKFDNIM